MNYFTLRRVDKDSYAFLDTKSIRHIVYNQVNLWGFCVTARRRKEETPTIQKPCSKILPLKVKPVIVKTQAKIPSCF